MLRRCFCWGFHAGCIVTAVACLVAFAQLDELTVYSISWTGERGGSIAATDGIINLAYTKLVDRSDVPVIAEWKAETHRFDPGNPHERPRAPSRPSRTFMPLEIKFERLTNLRGQWAAGRFGEGRTAERIDVRLPVLLLAAIVLWLPLSAALLWASRRRAPGRCAACGYDLRALSGRCPECGSTETEARLKSAGRGEAAFVALLLLMLSWIGLAWLLSARNAMRLVTLVNYEVPTTGTSTTVPTPGAATTMLWLEEHSLCLARFSDFMPDSAWSRLIPTGAAERLMPARLTGLMWLEPSAGSGATPGYQALRVPLWIIAVFPVGWLYWWARCVRAKGGLYFGRAMWSELRK